MNGGRSCDHNMKWNFFFPWCCQLANHSESLSVSFGDIVFEGKNEKKKTTSWGATEGWCFVGNLCYFLAHRYVALTSDFSVYGILPVCISFQISPFY